MLLLIDAGNTRLKICLYDRGVRELIKLGSAEEGARNSDELCMILKELSERGKAGKPEGAVISSVVTGTTPLLTDAVRKAFGLEPVIVDHRTEAGLLFFVKKSEEVGADRIANAAAANRLYKGNKIIVDFGTATTFCAVTEEGGFRGGAIMPGIGISASVLADRTSKLPEVALRAPERVLGEDTVDALLSGIIIGHAGAVERICKDIAKETSMDYNLITTGGFAEVMAPFIRSIKEVDADLTFRGLNIIYDLNS
jgi:type III pantothenate kinase